jgi:prevent-host-death family protein
MDWLLRGIEVQVNILEAKNRLSELIRSAQAGQEVVIANRGQPVVRLVPTEPQSVVQRDRDLLGWLQSNPLKKHSQKSAEEIDARILLERNAWD